MSSISSRAAQRRALFLTSLVLSVAVAIPAWAQQGNTLSPITVTASRAFNGITGASTAVITADDIAHAPAQSLQEIIAQTPGVQLTSLYGGVNGAGSAIDLRGFGAFATANTLVLINGRRLNDLDLAGVDLSSIPRDSIERIEVTKGNSGAVLYGDNAVGGVVNILTRSGAGGPPVKMRVEAGGGSFNQQQGAVSAALNAGAWSSSFYGTALKSNGYRDNNALSQRSAIGDLRYTTPDFSAFVTLSGDDQRLGLPGGRTVDPSIGLNQLLTDRRGAATPLDFADKQGVNVTAGFARTLWSGAELIVDGGVRNKDQQGSYFGQLPLSVFNASHVDTHLQTWSLTPRLSMKNIVFGLPSDVLTGIDYYDAAYRSNRSQLQASPPIHVYDLSQRTLAAYWQQTLGVLPGTDFSYGGRIQRTSLDARDRFDSTAPGAFDVQAHPLSQDETQHALHVGFEHRVNEVFTLFGRAASAFRTPNVDERVSSGPSFDASFNPIPGTFALKTQTSRDIEAGFRIKAGAFAAQSSLYGMDLANEIHYNPVLFYNTNLDPTRRYGSETSASLRVSEPVLLRGGLALTRAIFREGAFAGNDIPLVSRLTASAGVTWNLWQDFVVFDATVRYWSSRRMDNDQTATQPLIPANATVDLKLSGAYDRLFWSVGVNNLFDAMYYDYAIASTATLGRFNAYPLPGRTYMVRAGATF
jgi:iron complex outermembrane receptor protein